MVIGLHGRIGAGKNEAAKRLALLSPDVVEVSFARKLKESAAALLGCTVDDLEQWKNDPDMFVTVAGPWVLGECDWTIRSFLQRYGTEAHRDVFGQDFWTNQAAPLDKDYTDALYVYTDVRFQNETDRIHDIGGIVVGIRGPNEDTGGHASEQPVECDVWIDNTIRDDGYAALDDQLRDLLDRLIGWCSLREKLAA